MIFQKEIADFSLCNQIIYYLLIQTLDLLYDEFIFLQPVMQLLQVFFINWKFLNSLG